MDRFPGPNGNGMKRRFFLSLLPGIMGACTAKQETDPDPGKEEPEVDGNTVNGTRIMDGNNVYGTILDTDGNPLKYVPVTDGYRFTRTDANGVYQMKADPRSTHVFYSLPSGYAIAQDSGTHLPAFHQKIDPTTTNRKDFTLCHVSPKLCIRCRLQTEECNFTRCNISLKSTISNLLRK